MLVSTEETDLLPPRSMQLCSLHPLLLHDHPKAAKVARAAREEKEHEVQKAERAGEL